MFCNLLLPQYINMRAKNFIILLTFSKDLVTNNIDYFYYSFFSLIMCKVWLLLPWNIRYNIFVLLYSQHFPIYICKLMFFSSCEICNQIVVSCELLPLTKFMCNAKTHFHLFSVFIFFQSKLWRVNSSTLFW